MAAAGREFSEHGCIWICVAESLALTPTRRAPRSVQEGTRFFLKVRVIESFEVEGFVTFVSVTRLRLRSNWSLVPVMWETRKITRQARRTSGFLGGRLLSEAKKAFWTLTAWEDGSAMNVFRTQGAHGDVMPKLLEWCDEAAVV